MVLHKVKKFTKGKKSSTCKTKNANKKHSNKSKTITGGGKPHWISRLKFWRKNKSESTKQLLLNYNNLGTSTTTDPTSIPKPKPTPIPVKIIEGIFLLQILDLLHDIFIIKSKYIPYFKTNKINQKNEHIFWKKYNKVNIDLLKQITITYNYKYDHNNNIVITAKSYYNFKKKHITDSNINEWLNDAISKFVNYFKTMKYAIQTQAEDSYERYTTNRGDYIDIDDLMLSDLGVHSDDITDVLKQKLYISENDIKEYIN